MKKDIKYTEGPDRETKSVADFLPSPKEMQRRNKQANGGHISINNNDQNHSHFKKAARVSHKK